MTVLRPALSWQTARTVSVGLPPLVFFFCLLPLPFGLLLRLPLHHSL